MKNKNLVDIYNKDKDEYLYKSAEHIFAKSQRTKEEVKQDSEAFIKAVSKYCDIFIKYS